MRGFLTFSLQENVLVKLQGNVRVNLQKASAVFRQETCMEMCKRSAKSRAVFSSSFCKRPCDFFARQKNGSTGAVEPSPQGPVSGSGARAGQRLRWLWNACRGVFHWRGNAKGINGVICDRFPCNALTTNGIAGSERVLPGTV
jgi:hypothetical protein